MKVNAQSCPTLHDPMDYSLPGSSTHGIFQTRVLEWVAIAFSMTNLDSILKCRDITLPTKVHLVKAMATHSSILAQRIPWTEELVGYSPRGLKELDMTEQLHRWFFQ